ncbi:MAG TPA: CBASS cGAMP-activated phospholipase [Tepidisphaeraceae bacterium]|nr:CBASS cGAMP-activated phospholipase [Tepidisphaeraceae bacterium]
MPYRILALDGGGIRGLYTAVLLDRLSGAVPGFLDNVQLMAGTSTGGIIALGLAGGMQTRDLVSLYQNQGPKIFDASWLRHLEDLGGLSGAQYDNANLQSILTQQFRTKTLNDLNKKVLIPSFDLDNGQDSPPASPRTWKPKFFHNFPGPDSDGTELIVDVALRTSAAPTYFPVYQHYVDGGVVANNPSMAALAQALDLGTGNQQLADLRLLSLGTGTVTTYVGGHDHDWGLAQWARPLVSLMIDGVMGVADYECSRLLGNSYFRLSPLLPQAIALDDVPSIPLLIQYANAVDLAPTIAWLQAHF